MTTKEFPYHIGDVVEGEVTGLQPYGVFVLRMLGLKNVLHQKFALFL